MEDLRTNTAFVTLGYTIIKLKMKDYGKMKKKLS